MNIAYLDCFSGVSGDMLLGALVGAGLPEDTLTALPTKLGLSGCRVEINQKVVNGLAAVKVDVHVEERQPHRHLADIEKILRAAELPAPARDNALAVFHKLAEAEARVHGCSVEKIHFHEVGGVDAIVDVVGAALGFHTLGIDKIVCSPLPMPRGWVNCAHGQLPLPAPAVCEILDDVPVYGDEAEQELVTPTGAALCRSLANDFGQMPAMRMQRVGYGAGSVERRDKRPNLLRLMIGQALIVEEAQRVEVIETHLDDWSPETWPHVAQRLMAAGALDVSLQPMHMKKGRPGFCLRVICDPAGSTDLREAIFNETTAIGLRYREEHRITLEREAVTVQTPFGEVRGKKIITPAGVMVTPEYEDCRRVALEQGVPLKDVYAAVQANA